MSGDTCDVCNRVPTVGVACSGLGAISFAYCAECANSHAEPLFMFEWVLVDIGEEVADHVRTMRTWVEGKYLTWDEFCESKRKKT